jgi:hypothetical protein
MTETSAGPVDGGRRRIDRVLSEDFLERLEQRDIAEVRALRRDAEQEEVDLSYVRRLLQGRMDLIRAELSRRSGGAAVTSTSSSTSRRSSPTPGAPTTARAVPQRGALAGRRAPARGRAGRRRRRRLRRRGPLRRRAARGARATGGLRGRRLTQRRRVQDVMDRCTSEIGRRYKAGEANVDDLLAES